MNILFITPYVPNLIRVRPFQLVRALIRRGHKITLATLWAGAEEECDLQALKEIGVRVVAHHLPQWRSMGNSLLALPTSIPLQARYCWQPSLARQLATLVQQEQYDVVHVEHLRAAQYGLLVQRLSRHNQRPLPVVWDSVDCISHLFEQAAQASRSRKSRLLTKFDLARTRRYEGNLVHQFARVVVTSPTDKAALDQLAVDAGFSSDRVHVVANGVDLEYFSPGKEPREPATLVFSGKMSYHANVAAALQLIHEIMPSVWAQHPEVKVWLAGKDPTAEITALTSDEAARGRIVVTGTVPDLRPYLRKSTLAVAPVPYGAGIQNKVLEAMACGAAVIASPQACSALQVQPGHDLLIANDAAVFAEAIICLLADQGQQRSLGGAARQYVERHHSWDSAAAQFEHLYQQTSELEQRASTKPR
jgi:sugar transferase (PEP-CTERM/EpsH1 system associated)